MPNYVLDFTSQQLKKVVSAMELGLSNDLIEIFANPELNAEQMQWIKNALLRNYDPRWVKVYSVKANTEFFMRRMYELITFLINWRFNIIINENNDIGLNDISLRFEKYKKELENTKKTDYDDPKFWKEHSFSQAAIVESLVNDKHIKRLCFLLEKGFDFDCVVKAAFLPKKDFDIFINLNHQEYNEAQLDEILNGMIRNVEYSVYISSDFSAPMMKLMLSALVSGVHPNKIRDNIWSSSNEADIKRLIREKDAFRTNQLSYQIALNKYKDKEIRRCKNCEEYYSVDEFWDLNVDNALCLKCYALRK